MLSSPTPPASSSGPTSSSLSPEIAVTPCERGALSRLRTVLIVILLGFTSLCINSAVGLIGPVFPLEARRAFPREAKRDAVAIGAVFSVGTFGFFLFAPLAGREVHLVSPKRIVILGTTLVSGGTILFSFEGLMASWSTFLGYSFVIRFCQGVGGGCVYAATFTLLAGLCPKAVASVTAAMEVFNGMGYIIGPAVGGVLYEASGFSTPFLVFGLFLATAGVMQAFVFPDPTTLPVQGVAIEDRQACSLLSVLAKPRALFILLLAATGGAALAYCQPTLSPFLADNFGMKPSSIGGCYILAQLAKTSLALAVGRLADKYPRIPILLAGVVCVSIGFLLMGLECLPGVSPPMVIVLVGFGLTGVGAAFTLVPTSAEITSVMRKEGFPDSFGLHGSIGGLVGSAKALGMGVGPTVNSVLTKSLSFSYACLMFGVLMAVLSFVLCVLFAMETWDNAKKRCRKGINNNQLSCSFYDNVSERTHLL